jgi:hypothetical protein
MESIQRCIAVLLLLGTPCLLSAQPKLILSIDYSRYRGDSLNTYLEVYYSFSDQARSEDRTGYGHR